MWQRIVLAFFTPLVENGGKSERTSLVSHSVQGEFAYRSGPWKTVYKIPGENLAASRGLAATVELYNLEKDIAEANNLATEYPELLNQFSLELRSLVQRGTSRPGPGQMNDVNIRFDTIQTERWAPLFKH